MAQYARGTADGRLLAPASSVHAGATCAKQLGRPQLLHRGHCAKSSWIPHLRQEYVQLGGGYVVDGGLGVGGDDNGGPGTQQLSGQRQHACSHARGSCHRNPARSTLTVLFAASWATAVQGQSPARFSAVPPAACPSSVVYEQGRRLRQPTENHIGTAVVYKEHGTLVLAAAWHFEGGQTGGHREV